MAAACYIGPILSFVKQELSWLSSLSLTLCSNQSTNILFNCSILVHSYNYTVSHVLMCIILSFTCLMIFPMLLALFFPVEVRSSSFSPTPTGPTGQVLLYQSYFCHSCSGLMEALLVPSVSHLIFPSDLIW